MSLPLVSRFAVSIDRVVLLRPSVIKNHSFHSRCSRGGGGEDRFDIQRRVHSHDTRCGEMQGTEDGLVPGSRSGL